MTEVFISYSRRDLIAAEELRAWLEKAGVRTWMDTELVGGARFADEIEIRITKCLAVIVLWTPSSIQSQRVKEEAHKALGFGKARSSQECQFEYVNFAPWLQSIEYPGAGKRRGNSIPQFLP